MRDQAGPNRKDGTMKDPVSDEAREAHVRPHLALAERELQWALAATDTPQLVEEILEARITSAQEYLQQWAQSTITWVS